ncbi:MAG: ABC transporter ATP-binding protein [Acholeplasmatales bacterium]|nr:MAG: ABC transporter ATP-binding protein [Acholeplasmatales bacterium]
MAIILAKVTKIYRSGEVETYALRDVDLTLENGTFNVVLGPSGSGKSTLLNMMSGLDTLTSGTLTIDDAQISAMNHKELTRFRRHNLGFVFQQYNLLQTLTVRENVQIGAQIATDPLEPEEILKRVGLENHLHKYPFQLSGGEQQRVSIARALVKQPKILFCDEPTGALDEATAKDVLAILQALNETMQTTILLITHNPSIAELGDHIIRMNSGEIVDVLTQKNKRRAADIHWT